MRLAAQTKGGYYPAHEAAVAYAASFLRAPSQGPFTILDPCAGEGQALRQFQTLLGCPPSQTFAIELDDSRANEMRTNLFGINLLAPADFFGCRATCNSFSFIWLNPPFDHSYGGYRVEERFLWQATEWLMPGGVMALVCPEDVFSEYSEARRHFMIYYENCTITPFPEQHRPFNEVVVLGHKRRRPVVEDASNRRRAWESDQAPFGFIYHLPTSVGPKVFEKVEPTESEVQQMFATSPLRARLTSPTTVPLPAPPLPLGIGHVALLLASGHLNGIVRPDDRPSHVVRGTARKRAFVSDVHESENSNGSTTTQTTISERIELVIRTVDQWGHIQAFTDAEPEGETISVTSAD